VLSISFEEENAIKKSLLLKIDTTAAFDSDRFISLDKHCPNQLTADIFSPNNLKINDHDELSKRMPRRQQNLQIPGFHHHNRF